MRGGSGGDKRGGTGCIPGRRETSAWMREGNQRPGNFIRAGIRSDRESAKKRKRERGSEGEGGSGQPELGTLSLRLPPSL